MNEALAFRLKPGYLKMLLAGLTSAGIVGFMYAFLYHVSPDAIAIANHLLTIASTYFFYKVIENIETEAGMVKVIHRHLRILVEVVRLFIALFLSAVAQFFLVARPIFGQEFTPNFFFIVSAVAIPTFLMVRLVFNLRDGTEKISSNQRLLLVLLSGAGSIFSIVLMHLLYRYTAPSAADLLKHAVGLLNLTYTVISIYFFYHVFNGVESFSGFIFKNRSARFFMEFIKLFVAIFASSMVQFYAVARPIYKQTYDPNFLFIVVAFSIPAAAIARIIFELRQAQELALQSRLAQAEAQYNLLETQMQPHFLFNTLNVLSELIYVDPDLACTVTQQLADLYREILTNSKRKFSNLESEISILKKYIQIQQIRFGDRIQFKCEVNPEYMALSIPSLILQTLVENAIKHGISPRQTGGDIELTVTPVTSAMWNPQGQMYEVCVANTGELYKGPKKGEAGTGLQNTKNRLDLFYGRSHGFNIYSDENKTYVKFRVPQQRELQETL